MAVIERLEPSKHVKGRFLVFLDTGAMLKVGEQELLDFCLRPGMALDEETLTRLCASGADTAARDRAARMVSRRPLSKGELVERLVSRGEGSDSAAKAADWLEGLGAVNDGEYGKQVVRHYDRMGYGPQRLREELRRRKVPQDCWEEALREARPQREAVSAFLAAKFRTRAVTEQELRRQVNALRRRGFGWEVIRDEVERLRVEAELTL